MGYSVQHDEELKANDKHQKCALLSHPLPSLAEQTPQPWVDLVVNVSGR